MVSCRAIGASPQAPATAESVDPTATPFPAARAGPDAVAAACRRTSAGAYKSRLREEKVVYVDRTLTCVDCGAEFVHSAEDQEYYTQKGFVSDPKRCPSCRASRRSMREAGEGAAHGSGASNGPREYFAVVCSRCGNQAQVPFKPHMDRPVYCSDCFRAVHAQGA
jgi:CxxC-x17-CxxC domain-containing protein